MGRNGNLDSYTRLLIAFWKKASKSEEFIESESFDKWAKLCFPNICDNIGVEGLRDIFREKFTSE